jgi:hypothetical protein
VTGAVASGAQQRPVDAATPLPPSASPAPSSSPPLRRVLAGARWPAVLVVALVLTTAALAVVQGSRSSGRLDPDSFAPAGSRAVAELLRAGDLEVVRVEDVEAAATAGDDPATTVVVPLPGALSERELRRLRGRAGRLVVVGADDRALAALGLPATAAPAVPVDVRRAACALAAAERAGDATVGGTTYAPTEGGAVGCYATGGRPTLLELPDDRATLLGDGAPLTNDRLAERGNAALVLGLLGQGEGVAWLLPSPGRALPEDEQAALGDLLPAAVGLAVLQLLVAAGVLALWRGRRLGRMVEEPLPVVVRAAEAVEGRSRLYRAAGARGSAADALRAGSRDRLARRLGLPPDSPSDAVTTDVARTVRRDPADVHHLLYGSAPQDDAALVRLAEQLRALETALTREVAGS